MKFKCLACHELTKQGKPLCGYCGANWRTGKRPGIKRYRAWLVRHKLAPTLEEKVFELLPTGASGTIAHAARALRILGLTVRRRTLGYIFLRAEAKGRVHRVGFGRWYIPRRPAA